MVYKYVFWPSQNLDVWLNASLKHDDDIQRQVKLLYCAVNKLRGSGVTDRGANCLPGRLNAKIGSYLAYFCINIFFRFS